MTIYRMATVSLALILLGCDPSTTPKSPPASAISSEPFQLRMVSDDDPSAKAVFDELRLQVFTLDVKAPSGHRASFWVEVWRDGKLDDDLSQGNSFEPPSHEPLEGRVTFSFMDGESMNSPKSRWSSRLEFFSGSRTPGQKPSSRTSSGQVVWVDDPLKAKGIKTRMSQTYPIATPVRPDRSYTLHGRAGSRGGSISMMEGLDTAEQAKKIDLVIFLRARIDVVPAEHLKTSGSMNSFNGLPGPIKD